MFSSFAHQLSTHKLTMVEIIPKPIERVPFWQKFLFYFSVLFLIGMIVSYFALFYLHKQSDISLQNLEETLEGTRTSEIVSLEKRLLDYRKKIRDFASLFEQHIFATKFFDLLEKKSHPKIFFSEIKLYPRGLSVSLSGQVDSFLPLGQQLLIFKAEPQIENFSLSSVSITEEGKIEFGVKLDLNPEIFLHQ